MFLYKKFTGQKDKVYGFNSEELEVINNFKDLAIKKRVMIAADLCREISLETICTEHNINLKTIMNYFKYLCSNPLSRPILYIYDDIEKISKYFLTDEQIQEHKQAFNRLNIYKNSQPSYEMKIFNTRNLSEMDRVVERLKVLNYNRSMLHAIDQINKQSTIKEGHYLPWSSNFSIEDYFRLYDACIEIDKRQLEKIEKEIVYYEPAVRDHRPLCNLVMSFQPDEINTDNIKKSLADYLPVLYFGTDIYSQRNILEFRQIYRFYKILIFCMDFDLKAIDAILEWLNDHFKKEWVSINRKQVQILNIELRGVDHLKGLGYKLFIDQERYPNLKIRPGGY